MARVFFINAAESPIDFNRDIDFKSEDVLKSLEFGIRVELLYSKGANSVKIVTLLNKDARRVVDIKADYIGFEIEDEFVIGFGLDYNEKYRNLPYIGVLKEECYKE